MIVPTGAVRVLVATKPVDFRKGRRGLGGSGARGDEDRSVSPVLEPDAAIEQSRRLTEQNDQLRHLLKQLQRAKRRVP